MPYFVFRIKNHREFQCLEQHEAYRDARNAVRALRVSDDGATVVDYRMVFAGDASEGESLLRTRRERTPSEDD